MDKQSSNSRLKHTNCRCMESSPIARSVTNKCTLGLWKGIWLSIMDIFQENLIRLRLISAKSAESKCHLWTLRTITRKLTGKYQSPNKSYSKSPVTSAARSSTPGRWKLIKRMCTAPIKNVLARGFHAISAVESFCHAPWKSIWFGCTQTKTLWRNWWPPVSTAGYRSSHAISETTWRVSTCTNCESLIRWKIANHNPIAWNLIWNWNRRYTGSQAKCTSQS